MIINALHAMNMTAARHNALSSTFANNDAKYAMINPIAFNGGLMADVFSREKALDMENMRNALMYQVATVSEQSTKDLLDKKIKSSFSIFA